jgi:hypothetical protein
MIEAVFGITFWPARRVTRHVSRIVAATGVMQQNREHVAHLRNGNLRRVFFPPAGLL